MLLPEENHPAPGQDRHTHGRYVRQPCPSHPADKVPVPAPDV